MWLKWAWRESLTLALLLSAGMVYGQLTPEKAERKRSDLYGDPLPRDALTRIGTVRLRHGDFVYCVAFSKDGKTLISGGADAMVRLWDVKTGKEVRTLQGHRFRIESVAVSPDGKVLTSCGQDGTVRFWDLATGASLGIRKTRGPLYTVAFSPDGQHLAACFTSIMLWDMPKAEKPRELEGPGKWIYCLAFTPDSKTLVSGGGDGAIRFWDVATGKEIRQVQGHAKRVYSVAFSPDGAMLASAGYDGLLVLRDGKTGAEQRRLFKGEPRACSRLAFSPDGKTLAWSYGADRTIHLFETATGKEIRQFKGSEHNIINTVAFSPDGKTIASGVWDSTVRLWDVQTGKELLASREPQGPVASLVFCANDKLLAGAPWGSMIYCWDAVTGKAIHRLAGHSERLHFVAASPDGQTLFSADLDGFVRRWDLAKAKELHCFRVNEDCAPVAVSPDGKLLAAENSRGSGRLYDLQSGKQMSRFGAACEVIFLPDGKSLMLHVPGQGLVRWDIAKNKAGAWLSGDNRQNSCMAVSPDGKTFASGTRENLVHRWNMTTDEQLSSLDGQQKAISSVAFSPDGRVLASGGEDGTIHLWEMLTGRPRVVLRGHKGPVLALTFSRDGRRLASGSKDTTALVWDLTGGIGTAPAKELAAEQLNDLWRSLAGGDAAKAYRSIWLLASAPQQSLPFLRARLRPIPAPDRKRVAQLLADLDSETFKVRTQARIELAKLGEAAATALREAAEKPSSLEVARQVKALREKLKNEKKTPSAERIRMLRAVEVLERIGTSDARQVLTTLASGAAEAQQTQEAKASLQRLAKQAKRPK